MSGAGGAFETGRPGPLPLEPGFTDPVHGAQAAFRAILDAMAHPGRICAMPDGLAAPPPAPLGRAGALVALTLCDLDTPVWLDQALMPAAPYLAFHCGAVIARSPADADFVFAAELDGLPPLDAFALGSDEYPDRSATLVIEVAALTGGRKIGLAGPGIDGAAHLAIAGLPERFWAERAALEELFPRGLDLLFTSFLRLAALPRSTRIAR
jgi:alpha-D-ribose 1-methylphosphonate 5-triphosphate synthase subunit PhnH